ncbi:hypothetical protein ABNZ43_03975 [Weissella sp. GP1]|uniref:hypothetical protein n=1 Tax=Weissella confusa TaxID=1583 RepID=UPI0032D9F16A
MSKRIVMIAAILVAIYEYLFNVFIAPQLNFVSKVVISIVGAVIIVGLTYIFLNPKK